MSDSSAVLIPILMCLCFPILFVGVGGGMLFYALNSWKPTNRAWGELGTRNGLTFKRASMFSSPELNGEYRHRPIRVYTFSSGGQGHGQRSTDTIIALGVNNPTNSILQITPSARVGNILGKMLNAQDVEIGNPTFDARFVIKSNPPDFAMKVLDDSTVQMGIMDIPDTFRIELKGSSLVYAKRDVENDVELLTRLFNTLSDLAERFEGNKAGSFSVISSSD